jgi:molybdopterin synthase catalytic subunit
MLAAKDNEVDLHNLVETVKRGIEGKNCGAVVTFTGIVRPQSHDGKDVERLEYEVFEEAARRALDEMVKGILMLHGVLDVAVCHKFGSFKPGEEVLYIVLATERSETAFNTFAAATATKSDAEETDQAGQRASHLEERVHQWRRALGGS